MSGISRQAVRACFQKQALTTRRQKWGGCCAIGIATALVIFGTVHAANATPQYSYDVQILGVTPPDFTGTGSSQLTNSGSGTTSLGSYSYSVLAGFGVLGDANGLSLATAAVGDVRSTTSFLLDNITLTGPVGVTFVDYNVNFTITGSFALSATGNAVANGLVGVADALGALPQGANASTGFNDTIGAVSPNSSVDISGTTHRQTGSNGSTVTVSLTMYTDINANQGATGSAGGEVDFLDPLSFPSDVSVFNFFDPATHSSVTGWTANSADGCIVNNQFQCGLASTASPVDEPPALPVFGAVFAASMLWLGLRRRFPASIA